MGTQRTKYGVVEPVGIYRRPGAWYAAITVRGERVTGYWSDSKWNGTTGAYEEAVRWVESKRAALGGVLKYKRVLTADRPKEAPTGSLSHLIPWLK